MAEKKQSPVIEVWLTQQNMDITCMVVDNDESTENLDIDSLSMRGAQREMTGWFIKKGYKPVGRWEVEESIDGSGIVETMRTFKLTNAAIDQAEAVVMEKSVAV